MRRLAGRNGRLWALAGAAAGVAAACGLHARTSLDEAPGIDRAELAGRLAAEGLSVGSVRTAALPNGMTVAVVTPQPSDGYPPQVIVIRLDGGRPAPETESICDPFAWATGITGDQFAGLDPATIDSVAWESWDGTDRRDLVIEISSKVTHEGTGYGEGFADMRGRCVYRVFEDPEAGPIAAAVLGMLVEADSATQYGQQSTVVFEGHEVEPVRGVPDQLDYSVTSRTTASVPLPSGETVDNPVTVITIRRFQLVGSGFEAAYMPLEEAGYAGGYGPPPIYGPAGTPRDDGGTPVYGDNAAGYGGTATDYAGTATDYDGTSTGYEDISTGYEETSAGEAADEGSVEEGDSGTSCETR